MDAKIRRNERICHLLTAALSGELTDGQAEELAQFDPGLIKLAFLAATKRIAEQNVHIAQLKAKLEGPAKIDPATPSGQRPVYSKPAAPKRKGKPGAKVGHVGTRRPRPQDVDERKEHRLEVCPDCGGELQRCGRTRTRTIEDILESLRSVVTEHTIHRDYCPACKKHVEPVVPDAMPGAAIGHRTVALSAWLHYGVGVSIEQVRGLLGGVTLQPLAMGYAGSGGS